MLFKALHCYYAWQNNMPSFKGDIVEGGGFNLVRFEEKFVCANTAEGAIEKMIIFIIENPNQFAFQGMYSGTWTTERKQVYFQKALHIEKPITPQADYHWVEVEPVEVIE